MLDAGLAAAALAMGFAGSPHCAAMCGPMCGAATGAAARSGRGATGADHPRLLALLAGRLAAYAAAGAVAAGGTAWLGAAQAAAPVLRPLWALLHVGALVLGLWMLWRGAAPAWLAFKPHRPAILGTTLATAPATATVPLVYLPRRPAALARSAAAGACLAVLPCGLLQSALLTAALASGPPAGAAVMAVFALASSAALFAAPGLWWRFGGGRNAAGAVRLAGGVLAGGALFALAHGLHDTIAALCAAAP